MQLQRSTKNVKIMFLDFEKKRLKTLKKRTRVVSKTN